jgi:CubicO group peptidase (beta-lactamase class C family)
MAYIFKEKEMEPFEKTDLQSSGLNQDEILRMQIKMKKDRILGCVILYKDKIAYEYYKNPKVVHNLHAIHSSTKSFISALIGICIQQKLIDSIDMPITSFFGSAFAKEDPRKQAITVYHLLTMSEGLNWPEFGDWHFFSPMEYSKDIISFILGREMEANPGERMNYNSGCSHLLSAIIQKVSGKKTCEFAEQFLFGPLGIIDYHWYEKQKVNLGANGLKLHIQDMLKFGSLYLHKGTFDGFEILPAAWVEESTKPKFLTYSDIGHYGMHWWTSEITVNQDEPVPTFFSMGLFGQFIIVVPKYDLVTVFVSENYGETIRPLQYFREYIASAIQ